MTCGPWPPSAATKSCANTPTRSAAPKRAALASDQLLCMTPAGGQFDVVSCGPSTAWPGSVRHFLEVLDELNHLHIEFISSEKTSIPPARWGGR